MILSIYLIGIILSFGIYVGAMHKLEIKEIDKIKPTYETVYEDKMAYLISIFSWLSILIILLIMICNKQTPTLKYSYKKLWDLYHSK